ncbi:MAG: UDP-3-O-acyl-N-acetylglucosamine deacetylase [Bauldia sp.]
MRDRQTTLAGSVRIAGVGVHSGETVAVTIGPAEAGAGFTLVRGGNAAQHEEMRADHRNVGGTDLCTTLTNGDWSVATVEHLLAALTGLGIDNAIIVVDGPEIPAVDGSAAPFVAAIDEAGIVALDAPRAYIRVLRPFRLEQGASFAELRPYEGRRFEIELDYASPVIGRQRFVADITPAVFRRDMAAARTFGFLGEVEQLWSRGLARGASLDNALVIGDAGVINPGGLRFPDEFVRHKAVDAVGDLALAGAPILGAYRSYRGGHRLNARMVETFLATDAWEWVSAPAARAGRHAELAVAMLEPELT